MKNQGGGGPPGWGYGPGASLTERPGSITVAPPFRGPPLVGGRNSQLSIHKPSVRRSHEPPKLGHDRHPRALSSRRENGSRPPKPRQFLRKQLFCDNKLCL